MRFLFLILLAKLTATLSRLFNIGAGSTWPGHLALKLDFRIFRFLAGKLKKGVILVAGTNGKTTTAKMIRTIMEMENGEIIHNESGANLLNGMASVLIDKTNWFGQFNSDWAIFETDEATLPLILKEVSPKIIVLLNLFRDQLDRYGEVDQIAKIWREALEKLTSKTTIIANADDPCIAYLTAGLKTGMAYFGLSSSRFFLKKTEHAADSTYCLNCGTKLNFAGVYFSHLGNWKCSKCGLKRPKPDLSNWENWSNLKGVYNRYNTLAAVLVGKICGINEKVISQALVNFQPAFGRQEEFTVADKKVRILLSKNPAGFNESLRTLQEFPGKKKTLLLALNDRIPDGRDVSWIWDVDFEMIPEDYKIIISGDRAYDMGLRIKYALENQKYNSKFKIYGDLKKAIERGLEQIDTGGTLYVLPTYSGMLEVRKIIGGRKIL